MHRFNINLDDEDYEALLKLSTNKTLELKKRVSINILIREAIKDYLKKKRLTHEV